MINIIQTRKIKTHDVVLYELCKLIYNNLSKSINYDHNFVDIKKDDSINLVYKKHRYDIAFKYKDCVVYIEIKIKKRYDKKYKKKRSI